MFNLFFLDMTLFLSLALTYPFPQNQSHVRVV